MADIIHAYCSTCLIIDTAPFKVCCDGHMEESAYFSLSMQAGNPSCSSCILQDKPLTKIPQKIGVAVKASGGYWAKNHKININYKTLGHLTEDHNRQNVVLNVVPQLPSLLDKYEFADIQNGGQEIHYFVDFDKMTYKIPVIWKGNRWIIPSIFEISSAVKAQCKTKPRGKLIFP
jgi:hypothetical protein